VVAKIREVIVYSISVNDSNSILGEDILKKDFEDLKNPEIGESKIKDKLFAQEQNLNEYLSAWLELSKESKFVYPSQGLLLTPHDYLPTTGKHLLTQEVMVKTLRMRRYFLELFNHPYRLRRLEEVNEQNYIPPTKIESKIMRSALKRGQSLSIGDLGAIVVGTSTDRVSRTERLACGPFVKLGRYSRHIFVGSSSPDVWNSCAAIATMAASHCLAGIPRNGILSDIKRQADIAEETFSWLAVEAETIGGGLSSWLLDKWRKNVMGTLEASPEKAIERAEALYEKGVRCFRVYSPEPGLGPEKTVRELRNRFGLEIEIFAGQMVDVEQSKRVEDAGADGLFVGIGGGGRCITGVRSGSAVDWPELVFQLRGEVGIPVIAEGGASDHIAVSLLLGASGISVSRVVAGGTIESPGGALYCDDGNGRLYKPYGGEASARTKYLDGKLLPFDIPSFVEGETTKAYMSYVKFVYPTLTYNLYLLIEDAILAMVFRGASNIQELLNIDPSPLRYLSIAGDSQRGTH
jgi:hypothetical protein